MYPPTEIVRRREAKGWSQADLARRTGTTPQNLGRYERDEAHGGRKLGYPMAKRLAAVLGCEPEDLMSSEHARVDTSGFVNVFDLLDGSTPRIQLDPAFLAGLLPNEPGKRLRTVHVDQNIATAGLVKGEIVAVDIDENRPTRAGLYAIEIAGIVQLRYLSPTVTGQVTIRSESPDLPNESADPADLNILGRARLKISTL